MSAFDPNHPLFSDLSDPRQILDRLRAQTRPGLLESRRQNFTGRPLNFSVSRRKWLLMAIDTRASDRGPQGTTTPGPLRMICQGRCVRQASNPQAAMVTIPLTKGRITVGPGRLVGWIWQTTHVSRTGNLQWSASRTDLCPYPCPQGWTSDLSVP